MEQVTEGLGNLAEAFLVSRRVSGGYAASGAW